MVAVSQAPSPESNPYSPLPVTRMVGPYPTITLIGQSFNWSVAAHIAARFTAIRELLPPKKIRVAPHLPRKQRFVLLHCSATLALRMSPNLLDTTRPIPPFVTHNLRTVGSVILASWVSTLTKLKHPGRSPPLPPEDRHHCLPPDEIELTNATTL